MHCTLLFKTAAQALAERKIASIQFRLSRRNKDTFLSSVLIDFLETDLETIKMHQARNILLKRSVEMNI